MSMTDELSAGLDDSPGEKTAGNLAAISYADIPYIPRRDLWPDHIPRGLVSIWAAHGGTGKGYLFAAVAARVVLGLPFPGEDQDIRREPGQVIWITSPGEDDQFEALAPRFRAAISAAVLEFGLDPAQAGPDGAICYIHDLSVWPGGDEVTLPADCGRLAGEIAEMNLDAKRRGLPPVVLAIGDSITGLLSDGFTINSRQGARRVARMLGTMARKADIAVVMINHLTQDGKVSGSPGLLAAVRVAYRIERVKDDERLRVILSEKMDGEHAQPVRYVFSGERAASHIRFVAAEDTRMERLTEARRVAALPPAETRVLPAAPTGAAWRVGRLTRRPGQADAQDVLTGSFDTPEKAMAAADRDAGQVLSWQAKTERFRMTPLVPMPDGSHRVYGVQLMADSAPALS